jgi:hypothetical protein
MIRSAVTGLLLGVLATPVFLATPVVLATPVLAQCGPTRLKVAESVRLDMPPAKAWAVLGNFQDMSWAKNTRATTGSGGNEPEKATRRVTLADGRVLEESLYRYNAEDMSYAYHIDKVDVAALPIQNTSVTIEVVPADNGKSIVRWRAAFYRFLKPDEPAADVADANAAKAVSTLGRQLLEGLKTRAEART